MRKSIPVPVKRASVPKKKVSTTVHASPITMPTAAVSPLSPPEVPMDSPCNSMRLSEPSSPVFPKNGEKKPPVAATPSVMDVLGAKDTLTLRYAVEQQSKMLELRDRLINHLSKMRDEAVAKHDVEQDALVCSLRMKNIALEKRIEMLCSCLSLPREIALPNPQLHRAIASPAENLVAITHTVPTASAPAVDHRPSSAKAEEDRRRVTSARRKILPPATSASTEDPQLFVLKSQNSMPVRPLKIKNPAPRSSMHDSDPPDHHTTARIVIDRVMEGRQPGVSASGGRSGSFIKVPKSPSLQSSALPLISSPQPGKR